MRRILLLMVIVSLTPLPLWAEYGKSNILQKEIHRTPVTPEPASAPVPAPAPAPAPGLKSVPAPAPAPTPAASAERKSCPKTVYYPFTIHILSSQDLNAARQEMERMRPVLGTVFISKTDLGAQGLWYRVDYGVFMSAKDAAVRLNELRQKGTIAADAFLGGPVPYTVELAAFDTKAKDALAKESARLRKLGLTTYTMEESQGCTRILTGAFTERKSAALVLTEVQRLGVNAKIAKR